MSFHDKFEPYKFNFDEVSFGYDSIYLCDKKDRRVSNGFDSYEWRRCALLEILYSNNFEHLIKRFIKRKGKINV